MLVTSTSGPQERDFVNSLDEGNRGVEYSPGCVTEMHSVQNQGGV